MPSSAKFSCPEGNISRPCCSIKQKCNGCHPQRVPGHPDPSTDGQKCAPILSTTCILKSNPSQPGRERETRMSHWCRSCSHQLILHLMQTFPDLTHLIDGTENPIYECVLHEDVSQDITAVLSLMKNPQESPKQSPHVRGGAIAVARRHRQ